jgi:hypothetical protein
MWQKCAPLPLGSPADSAGGGGFEEKLQEDKGAVKKDELAELLRAHGRGAK